MWVRRRKGGRESEGEGGREGREGGKEGGKRDGEREEEEGRVPNEGEKGRLPEVQMK